MPYSVKGFFEIDEDMVQILLELEVLFTQDSEVEVLATWYKKVVAKLTYPVANIGGHVIAQLPSFVRFMTKHNSIWSKALIMPLTYGIKFCLISKRIITVKMGMFFQEITSIKEFPGGNCLLPTI